jgi:predicted GIY-YIG superfamily endonuclease
MIFNLLECFDENIDNLDITQNFVYALKLVEDRYYIGRTGNILRRIEEHFTNNGSIYTKMYKPIKVIEIIEERTKEDEKNKTIEYMLKYGWEKVRGYTWCSIELLKPPKINMVNKKSKKIFCCNDNDSNNDKIKILYTIEKKDIIEIGKELNRSPGSIAYTLEKLGIIERKQQALGFFDYINSEDYRNNCNVSINRKLNVKKNIATIKKDIQELKTELIDIKKRIKDILRA